MAVGYQERNDERVQILNKEGYYMTKEDQKSLKIASLPGLERKLLPLQIDSEFRFECPSHKSPNYTLINTPAESYSSKEEGGMKEKS